MFQVNVSNARAFSICCPECNLRQNVRGIVVVKTPIFSIDGLGFLRIVRWLGRITITKQVQGINIVTLLGQTCNRFAPMITIHKETMDQDDRFSRRWTRSLISDLLISPLEKLVGQTSGRRDFGRDGWRIGLDTNDQHRQQA